MIEQEISQTTIRPKMMDGTQFDSSGEPCHLMLFFSYHKSDCVFVAVIQLQITRLLWWSWDSLLRYYWWTSAAITQNPKQKLWTDGLNWFHRTLSINDLRLRLVGKHSSLLLLQFSMQESNPYPKSFVGLLRRCFSILHFPRIRNDVWSLTLE